MLIPVHRKHLAHDKDEQAGTVVTISPQRLPTYLLSAQHFETKLNQVTGKEKAFPSFREINISATCQGLYTEDLSLDPTLQ